MDVTRAQTLAVSDRGGWTRIIKRHQDVTCTLHVIRGEPERAPNTRGTGSGFICIYVCIYTCMYVCGVII